LSTIEPPTLEHHNQIKHANKAIIVAVGGTTAATPQEDEAHNIPGANLARPIHIANTRRADT
jgi:hypothetical protein